MVAVTGDSAGVRFTFQDGDLQCGVGGQFGGSGQSGGSGADDGDVGGDKRWSSVALLRCGRADIGRRCAGVGAAVAVEKVLHVGAAVEALAAPVHDTGTPAQTLQAARRDDGVERVADLPCGHALAEADDLAVGGIGGDPARHLGRGG